MEEFSDKSMNNDIRYNRATERFFLKALSIKIFRKDGLILPNLLRDHVLTTVIDREIDKLIQTHTYKGPCLLLAVQAGEDINQLLVQYFL